MRLRFVIAALSVMDELLEGVRTLGATSCGDKLMTAFLPLRTAYYWRTNGECQIRSQDKGRLVAKAPKIRAGPAGWSYKDWSGILYPDSPLNVRPLPFPSKSYGTHADVLFFRVDSRAGRFEEFHGTF
jgi:hypothetical protein